MRNHIVSKMTSTGEVAEIPSFISATKINEFRKSSNCNLSIRKEGEYTIITRTAGVDEIKGVAEDELFTELVENFSPKTRVIQVD